MTTHAHNNALYAKVIRKGLRPKHVAEVGVHQPESSNIYRFIRDGIRTTLVEPEPESIEQIRQHFSECDHVTLHTCAMCDAAGEIELFKKGPSTFVGHLPDSPAMVNDGYVPAPEDRFSVRASTFDTVDDGSIDLLSVDTEGSEWYVIKHLVSRPTVISVETHGGAYVNPFLADIECWMEQENYCPWYKGKTDTVYVRPQTVPVTLAERVNLAWMNARIRLRRTRKRMANRR